ncbi:hypothetical protein [Longirhabdus pacifica]|uniref:hypothetical protein n=1 Tax=Longirhabdus pacifica TaxID=2305227 RepID=UPI001008FC66|nr:hypothetical protein [Longirhabdus pacifica]
MQIPIEDICKKIFRDEVIDIFYIIWTNKEISKTDIAKTFKQAVFQDEENIYGQKFKSVINESIAKLEGATFVDYFKEGVAYKYFLTETGEVAKEFLQDYIEENSSILRGSKVLKKVMEEGGS